ncbi:hypothetical protein C8J56DRAFT_1037658 [Mycena floridula]|nr:hypothetical protein C8J56DRAFT_1037658 [Mycena floridula]
MGLQDARRRRAAQLHANRASSQADGISDSENTNPEPVIISRTSVNPRKKALKEQNENWHAVHVLIVASDASQTENTAEATVTDEFGFNRDEDLDWEGVEMTGDSIQDACIARIIASPEKFSS